MKTVFKLLALLILMQTCRLSAQTSNPLRIGFGISNGIPTTSNPFGYILGGDIRLQKGITAQTAVTFSAGFNHYFETQNFNQFPDYPVPYNSVPVKAGLKVFAGKNLYFAGEAGAAFFLEGGRPTFIWSPSVGLAMKSGLDVSIKYEHFSNYKALNQVALRVAYGLPVRKVAAVKDRENGPWGLDFSINPGINLDNGHLVTGADLELERRLSARLSVTLRGGFTHLDGKTYKVTYTPGYGGPDQVAVYNTDTNTIPVLLGLKIHLNNRLYVAGAAGIGIDINGNSSFIYSATTGYQLSKRFDIGIKYERSNYNSNQLAARLTYHIF